MDDSTTLLPNGERICSEPNCAEKHYALGKCRRHWEHDRYWAEPEKYRKRRRDRHARQRASLS